jgi:hypothetical protein
MKQFPGVLPGGRTYPLPFRNLYSKFDQVDFSRDFPGKSVCRAGNTVGKKLRGEL